MTIEERMDRLERSAGKSDALVFELRDAVAVTRQLEPRQGRMLKEPGEWLESHNKAMAEHEAAMKRLDKRIAGLVSGIGEFMRRSGVPPVPSGDGP